MPDDDPISLEEISNAPPEPKTQPKGLGKRELDTLAHEAQQFKDELGWLGKPFGGRAEKPGNISALVIFLCFVSLIIVYIPPQT